MLTFAILAVAFFFLGAFLVTGLLMGALCLQNYHKNREWQPVTCPDSPQAAGVQVHGEFAFLTALRGQEHSRMKSCSRWPEKDDCGQKCLAEIETSPENVDRLLTKWYEGKSCAICTRALSPSDWRRSRLAVLNQQHQIFELRHMLLDQLQATLENMRPLCWNCHQEERARQAVPPRIPKRGRQFAPAMNSRSRKPGATYLPM